MTALDRAEGLIAGLTDFPTWTSPVESGPTHDLTAADTHLSRRPLPGLIDYEQLLVTQKVTRV